MDLTCRTIAPSLHLEVVGASVLWPCFADPPQLENALLNLCISAREVRLDGGHTTIETANKSLDEDAADACEVKPGQYVSVSNTDTPIGIGMPPEISARAEQDTLAGGYLPICTEKRNPVGHGGRTVHTRTDQRTADPCRFHRAASRRYQRWSAHSAIQQCRC